MRLIELHEMHVGSGHGDESTRLLCNINDIASVHEAYRYGDYTKLVTLRGQSYYVKESYKQVLDLIEEADDEKGVGKH